MDTHELAVRVERLEREARRMRWAGLVVAAVAVAALALAAIKTEATAPDEIPETIRARALGVSVPPAELVVLAGYPVTVEVAGLRHSGEGEIRLAVPPGSHMVELSAPEVFYAESRSVALASEESRTLELPRTVTIPVAAEGHCRLTIDAREVGDLPARVELTIGIHWFRFEWAGGLVKEQSHNIGPSTQRIYKAKPQ